MKFLSLCCHFIKLRSTNVSTLSTDFLLFFSSINRLSLDIWEDKTHISVKQADVTFIKNRKERKHECFRTLDWKTNIIFIFVSTRRLAPKLSFSSSPFVTSILKRNIVIQNHNESISKRRCTYQRNFVMERCKALMLPYITPKDLSGLWLESNNNNNLV